jgi:hypothetical protein
MDLQADINWIVAELRKVNDPDLIAAFKNLLRYRRRREETDWWNKLPVDVQQGIEEGLKDLEEGRTSTYEEVRDRITAKHGI